jgi:hypothetical protein
MTNIALQLAILLTGFAVMALCFLIIAVIPGMTTAVVPFLLVYGVSYFFTEFGPNMTTFVMPSELYPITMRATRVVMPPTAARPREAELLLCGHHRSAGAVPGHTRGQVLAAQLWCDPAGRRRSGNRPRHGQAPGSHCCEH